MNTSHQPKVFDLESAVAARQANPDLTVFDTGEMLEPKPWHHGHPGSGSVDFDNDEGVTEVTVFAHPSAIEPETVVVSIDTAGATNLIVVVNDGTVAHLVNID